MTWSYPTAWRSGSPEPIWNGRCPVVGVLAPRGRSLGFDFDDLVFVPARTAMRIFNRSSLFRILVELPEDVDLEEAKAAVIDLLAERHRA